MEAVIVLLVILIQMLLMEPNVEIGAPAHIQAAQDGQGVSIAQGQEEPKLLQHAMVTAIVVAQLLKVVRIVVAREEPNAVVEAVSPLLKVVMDTMTIVMEV
jgi:hypothetical protein